MRKTPQEFRRENVKELFEKVLKNQKTKLEPLKISVDETWESDFTTVDVLILYSKGDEKREINIRESQAKGFVDGVFKGCHNSFIQDAPSLSNIKLVDYKLTPSFKNVKDKTGSDASVEVSIMMEVKDHGLAEFSSSSRSILYSSMAATLEAFEFYINCEDTFRKIKLILEDAKHRNRADIVQSCISDLSKITEVNTYVSQ